MMLVQDVSQSETRTFASSSTAPSDSSSVFTSSTKSTRSTILGPGALSGKAILALGKATLRGAESIIIRRRLNVIASKFPRVDVVNVKGIEEMYDDLLELSRRNMYSNDVRFKALHILLVQISFRAKRHIIKCLGKWPDVEVQIFLQELMTLFDPIRLSDSEVKNKIYLKAYRSGLSPWESHSLLPIVDFLNEVVQALEPSKSPIPFHSDLLDFLLHMYVTNFCDPLAETERGAIHRTSPLYSACGYILTSLCDNKYGLAAICDHPLGALWPTRPRLPFTIPLGLTRVARRLEAWNNVPKNVVLWWLLATFNMVLDFTRTIDESVMHDVCVDMLELSGSDTQDMEIRMRALRSLYQVSAHRNVAAQNTIRDYLVLQTREHSVRLISRIIKNLERIIPVSTPESKFFFLKWDHADFILNAVLHFLHLFMNLAEHDETIRIIFLAADILGLMRPFLERELQGKGRIAVHEGDFLTVYDPPDFELLELIKERGLEELLDPFSQEGVKYAFVYRRSLLCRAFNVFLGRGDVYSRAFPELQNLDWDDFPSELDESSDYAALWITP